MYVHFKEIKRGNYVSFWPLFKCYGVAAILTVMYGVIVPSDLAQSFGVIYAHYRFGVIHRAITYMHAWFKSTC